MIELKGRFKMYNGGNIGNMKKITRSIRITEENWEVLRELANKDNRTVSNYLENIIEKHIKQQLSVNSNNE